MQSFDAAWLIGLAVFGVHLVLLGVLVLRSGLAPRVMAVLLMVAGAAYVLDTVAHVALPDYAAVAGVMLALVAVAVDDRRGLAGPVAPGDPPDRSLSRPTSSTPVRAAVAGRGARRQVATTAFGSI